MSSRYRLFYETVVRPDLLGKMQYKNVHQIPKVKSISVSGATHTTLGRGLDNLTALPHPEALNRQCPWEFTLACHADTNCAGRAAPSPPS